MPLTPIDEIHALQIQAGTIGRHLGHAFEAQLAQSINLLNESHTFQDVSGHIYHGSPEVSLLNYLSSSLHLSNIQRFSAIATGALATSEEGKRWLNINGVNISRCKSDLLVTFEYENSRTLTIGVSVKQCSNPTPTNAQLYFTTACGFFSLLTNNGIAVSNNALTGC